MRKKPLAAFASPAALGAAAPGARAAVVPVSSNQERSPEYLVSGGGTGRLQGTVAGSVSAAGGPPFPDDQPALPLPGVRFEPLDGVARVHALAPLTFQAQAGAGIRSDAAVDAEVDLNGVSGFRVLPDFASQQGTGPTGGHTPAAVFTGTPTTVEAANVPEPASFAPIGLGRPAQDGRRGVGFPRILSPVPARPRFHGGWTRNVAPSTAGFGPDKAGRHGAGRGAHRLQGPGSTPTRDTFQPSGGQHSDRVSAPKEKSTPTR